MNKLVEALKNTIDQLKSHPLIAVDEAGIYEPATPELIDNFEIMLNLRLPKNIKDFYLAANGLKCIWRIRPGLPADVMNKIKNEGEQKDFDYSKPLGAINILPVQDMLMNKYWKPPFQDESGTQPFEFNNKQTTLGVFAKQLKIFDAYFISNDFECIALITETDKIVEQFYLLMLDDNFADWHNSRIIDFETYILAMCATKFTIPSRRRLFGKYRGDREPVLTYEMLSEPNIEPALFRQQ